MSLKITRKNSLIASGAVIGVAALAFGTIKLVRYVRKDMEERECDSFLEYAMDKAFGKPGSQEDEDFEDFDDEGPMMESAGEG